MPSNSEPRKTVKLTWDEQSVGAMAAQITESLAASRGLLKTLQDELLVNTRIRVEVQKDLQHLFEKVSELNKIILKGNGQKSLIGQIAALQAETLALAGRIVDLSTHTERVVNKVVTVESKFDEAVAAFRDNLGAQSAEFRSLLSDEIRLLGVSVNERIALRKETEKEAEEKKEREKDRRWALVVEMTPHVLTWLALAAYVVYHQLQLKNLGP